ncbi:MAG: hypothetical protein AB7N91_32495 [Candidatus Tectimicrobiota bacterium]
MVTETVTPPAVVDHPVAGALVSLFQVLAVVCGVLGIIVIFSTAALVDRVGAAGTIAVLYALLTTVVTVALMLAIAEGLRLGMAIERNTRGEPKPGQRQERARRRPR